MRKLAQRNRFLSACRDETLSILLKDSALVPLQAKTVLYEAGTSLSHGIFPLSGLIVGLHPAKSGASVVGGHVGSEGLIGGITSLEDERTGLWSEITVLLSGEAIVVPLATVRDTVLRRHDATLEFLVWSAHVVRMIAQLVMCSRFHSVAERTACWLLVLQDKLEGGAQVPITHDQLSQTLGVHRPSITLGLKELARNQCIAPGGRGIVDILDRTALEALSYECHPVITSRGPTPSWVAAARDAG